MLDMSNVEQEQVYEKVQGRERVPDQKALIADLEKLMSRYEYVSIPGEPNLIFSEEIYRILELAISIAEGLGSECVGTEHIVLGFAKVWRGLGSDVLIKLGVVPQKLYHATLKEILLTGSRGGDVLNPRTWRVKPPTRAYSASSFISWLQYKRNTSLKKETETSYMGGLGVVMTRRAVKGFYNPLIGRDGEVERMVAILSRKTKSNPVLLGEAGVGKTAVVEGLAQRLVSQDVPKDLIGCSLVSLNLVSVVANTRYRGQLEGRVKRVKRDMIRSNREGIKKVLFIDEIHSLVGAGETEGSQGVGNMLKPALARGNFKCIGATTLSEYAKYFEGDGAMERRFQPVKVVAPTIKETVMILKGIWPVLEKYHQVKIEPEAIVDAANYSDRYITDRNMPDKAIDVLDEACSRVKFVGVQKSKRIQNLEHQLNEIDKKLVDLPEYELYTQGDLKGEKVLKQEFRDLIENRELLLIRLYALVSDGNNDMKVRSKSRKKL
jgi:ATP-dependent Clp protease ATP-binding subunit ClpC